MIEKKFLAEISRKTGIKAEALEKDYIMSFILDAMANCPSTKDSCVLKGGSCIYKCFRHDDGLTGPDLFKKHQADCKNQKELIAHYVTNGRISKDLDITISPDLMNTDALMKAFKEVQGYLLDIHNIKIDKFGFPIYENTNQTFNGRPKRSCRGELHFEGPMFDNRFCSPVLGLDITCDEKTAFAPVSQKIYHPYGDFGGDSILTARTYAIEDIFTEKYRSLMERVSSHDLFDVYFLSQHPLLKNPMHTPLAMGLAIIDKFRAKNIPLLLNKDSFESRFVDKELVDAKTAFQQAWTNRLSREKDALPDFNMVWNTVDTVIDTGIRNVRLANQKLDEIKFKNPQIKINDLLDGLIRENPATGVTKMPVCSAFFQSDGR